jgi:hypothetical protein
MQLHQLHARRTQKEERDVDEGFARQQREESIHTHSGVSETVDSESTASVLVAMALQTVRQKRRKDWILILVNLFFFLISTWSISVCLLHK